MIARHDIEDEILQFYGKLVGTANPRLNGITIVSIRKWAHLYENQRYQLIDTQLEIAKALKGISGLTTPRIDGYGAKLFKAT